MIKNKLACTIAIALLATLSPIVAHADGPVAASAETLEAKFQADRRLILAMAGNYNVKFDFQETTAWQPDYTPIAPKISGGHEVVRVIEDTGRIIKLQHMLVAEDAGKIFVIKHWRQDWTYEPASVLVYAGTGKWVMEDVPERMRKGRWSQTVWQVDDSPRYGGWGQFEEQGGVRRWRSNWTWRPLARRDAIRNPVYDRYTAINRHQSTPTGWIHWQDNTKMALRDGRLVPIVQEYVLNTYTRADDYDVAAADRYWAATAGYWAAVRAAWADIAARKGGIGITEEAQMGNIISSRLFAMGDAILAGTMTEDAAAAEARTLIDTNTRTL